MGLKVESESESAQSCPTLLEPRMGARQAPQSMGFSRQEYWSGLPFPSPRDLPDSGIEPRFPALQADSLPTEWERGTGRGSRVVGLGSPQTESRTRAVHRPWTWGSSPGTEGSSFEEQLKEAGRASPGCIIQWLCKEALGHGPAGSH